MDIQTPVIDPVSHHVSDSKAILGDSWVPEELKVALANQTKDQQPIDKGTPQDPPPQDPPTDDEIQQTVGDDKVEDEIDINPENIDKLLAGDLEAIKKGKKTTAAPEEETFPWHDTEEYKELIKHAKYAGFDQKKIDKLIQEASDKKILDKAEYIKGLEKSKEDLARDTELTKTEVARLKQVERAAYFDTLPETQEKFTKPMSSAIVEMKKILDMEGAPVKVSQLLDAKDRASFVNLIKDIPFTEEDTTRITNIWRSYRALDTEYSTAKLEAQNNLTKFLGTSLPNETVTTVFRNSLGDLLKEADPQYNYIREAVTKDITKYPEVSEIIGRAHANFSNLIKAFGNPKDVIHNPAWLGTMNKFFVESAHHRNMAGKVPDLQAKLAKAEEQLTKVVVKYRDLAKSAKGINGSGPGLRNSSSNPSTRSANDDLEEFKKVLAS
jgi:DNA-binding transcriptional MerR regulator